MQISGSRVQGQSLKRTLTVTDEKCNRLANKRAQSKCLRGETMAGKRVKRERTAIGSLYCRIQEVKSGAVMPWTGHTYSTGE